LGARPRAPSGPATPRRAVGSSTAPRRIPAPRGGTRIETKAEPAAPFGLDSFDTGHFRT
jgi:hypothetical protein